MPAIVENATLKYVLWDVHGNKKKLQESIWEEKSGHENIPKSFFILCNYLQKQYLL